MDILDILKIIYMRLPKKLRPGLKKLIPRKLKPMLSLTPMQKVLRKLKKHNIKLDNLHALEMFGRTGEYITKDYAPYVSTLDIWEIETMYEETLKQNFPNADIKITDSYEEIKKCQKKYNLIVIDNPMSIYGQKGEHCEHFGLFPNISRIAMDSTIMIINVIPKIDRMVLKKWPYLFNEKQLTCRKYFYKTDAPQRVSLKHMVKIYRELALTENFELKWCFFQKRSFIYFLVFKIEKCPKAR